MWLTGAGIEGAGLGGVRPVKSPPAPTTIAHGVLVGWSAARVERRGRAWKSARELAVEREQVGASRRAASAAAPSSCPTSPSGSNAPSHPSR